jgi:hypothetical protein
VVCFSSAIVDGGGGSGKHFPFPFIRLGLSLFPSPSLSSPRQSKVLVQQGEQVPVKPPPLACQSDTEKIPKTKIPLRGPNLGKVVGKWGGKEEGGKDKTSRRNKERGGIDGAESISSSFVPFLTSPPLMVSITATARSFFLGEGGPEFETFFYTHAPSFFCPCSAVLCLAMLCKCRFHANNSNKYEPPSQFTHTHTHTFSLSLSVCLFVFLNNLFTFFWSFFSFNF